MNVAAIVGITLSSPITFQLLPIWPPGFRMATLRTVGDGNSYATCGVGP
jgi:hypothetical protein